jgi:hypothetical protein
MRMADSLAKLPRNGRGGCAGFFDRGDQLALPGSVGGISQRVGIVFFPRCLARSSVNADQNSFFLHNFQRAALAALWLFHLAEVVINLSSKSNAFRKALIASIEETASTPVASTFSSLPKSLLKPLDSRALCNQVKIHRLSQVAFSWA